MNGLRMQINADCNRRPAHPILIEDVIDHYLQTELSPNSALRPTFIRAAPLVRAITPTTPGRRFETSRQRSGRGLLRSGTSFLNSGHCGHAKLSSFCSGMVSP